MPLRIYNTLSRQLVDFVPIQPGKVGLYVCGITVYDLCHVGHARSNVAFDVARRWLEASGLAVTHVRNITDIDDKIIRRAVANGESIHTLTARMIAAMDEDFARLGLLKPHHEPRATDFVPQMLDLVSRLQARELAYQAGGDVLYPVRRFKGYGKLSGKSLDQLHAGERVSVAEGKDDPLDFVLWKAAKAEEPDEVKWPSPFGTGRPGWHLECSAMCQTLLGDTFDIHGGGADLQFPHHENEIAQSEGASGVPLARLWMHNGFVNVDSQKMSKSLDNFFTIRDVLQRFDAQTLRFFLLRTHYRSPLNYSEVHLQDAQAGLRRLYTALLGTTPSDDRLDASAIDWRGEAAQAFAAAMNNDFGTPEAVAVLFDLAGAVNRAPAESPERAGLALQLRQLGGVLGLLQGEAQQFLQAGGAVEADWLQSQIEARAAAKRAKQFVEADAIRKALLAQGVVLKDGPAGTTWEIRHGG